MTISPHLAALAVPIDSVQPHPRNYRDHDLGALMASVEEFGQMRPVLVQKSTGFVIAGNGTYKAMRQAGAAQIAAVFADVDDITAERYLVADNRTQQLGSEDEDALADLLTDLASAGALEATGYDGDDLDDLLERLHFAPPEPNAWSVEVVCDSQDRAEDLARRLMAEGYSVKPRATKPRRPRKP